MCEKLKRLQICVTCFLILLVLAAIILIGITVNFHRTFTLYLMKNEKQTLFSELSIIYINGFELLVCYSAGLCMCRLIWKGETFQKYILLTAVWNGISFLIVICGFAHLWFLYTRIELLQTVVKSSLFKGMDLYFSNPQWKFQWDAIQYQHECCGVNGYGDWQNASWIPDEENKFEPTSGQEMILIPYTCCKRTASLCFQTFTPHLTAFATPNLNSSDINSNGCLPMLMNLSARFYVKISVIMLYVLILHMLLLISQIRNSCESKKVSEGNCDERPLIVVKYPHNVRCITLTDDNFKDDVEEQNLSECAPSNQSISTCHELNRNIFLH